MDNVGGRQAEQPFPVSSSERRHAHRYYVNVRVEFPGGRGTTRDVSELGVCFETDQRFQEGAPTAFQLVFRDNDPSWRIAGAGVVVRVEESGDRFVVAVRVTGYGFV